MSSLFQLKFRPNIRSISVIAVLNSIINYLIYFNKEVDIGYVVPIIAILITFLYLTAVVKVPTIWSLVVSVVGGTVAPLVVQLGIVFGSFGFFMPSELKEHIWRNYAIDITSGLIYCLVSFLLYSRGWSFKFDFEKIRLKWEHHIVITITVCSALCLPVAIIVTHINELTLNLTFLSVSSFLMFVFLLGYAIKKEQDEIKFLKPIKEVKVYD
jgi:hypothetical protein